MAAETRPFQGNEEMGRIGKALVAQLFVLFKTSLNYSEGHAAIEGPAANVLKVVLDIARRNEEAALRVKGGHFYLGELRLKTDSAGFEAGRFVMDELRRHLLGGISFSPAATAEELCRFVYILREVDAAPSADIYGKIQDLMVHRLVTSIEIETLPEEVEADDSNWDKDKEGKITLNARLLFKKALGTMDEVMASAGAGMTLRLRGTKRIVQHMIDLLPNNESSLLGLTTVPWDDAYAHNHAVNVCILCLVMGKKLGLSKYHLCELGMAALFHDIGKIGLPPEILERGVELSPEDQQILEAHPLYGVKTVMKSKGLDNMSARIITGVFEHHLLADFSGYPRFPYRRLSLFGRIISIADGYDGLTRFKVRGGTPYPPDKALRFMLTRGGKAYDTGLLKLFINCIGIHGIGSLLLLDTRELAVVVENNPAKFDNPKIRVIADANGREVDGEPTELSTPDCKRTVYATLDANLYNLDVSRYFF